MVDAEALEKYWWRVTKETAQSHGLDIAPDCAGLVRQFIHDGVQRITREGHLDDTHKLGEAHANLVRFVAKMVKEANQQQLPALHEPTFDAARGLCPLWPFC